MESFEQRTEISSLGEFGLIEYLTRNIELKQAGSILGVGDDAAVIDHFGKQTVISSDLLLEGIHFDLMYTPLKHLGYKSVVVNLSDIYAMNAQPTQILLSLAFSNRFSVEALTDFYEGVYLACEQYGVDLAGGDTSSSQKGFIISGTAVGEVIPGNFVRRSTARNKDLVCVSGDLGAAYLGLQILEREKRLYQENPSIRPDLGNETYVIGRQLRPEARKDIIGFFEREGLLPTALMDISDGLSSELLHICRQSGLGCLIFEEKIPILEDTRRVAFELGLDPTLCALSGGEDYELLFTVRQEDYEKVLLSNQISVIGYMTDPEEGSLLQTPEGIRHRLIAQGWNAFP